MITRKRFLKTTSVALAGIPFAALLQCTEKEEPDINCTTGEDILGPFYRADAPFRTAFNVLNEAGTPVFIEGKVLGGPDCSIPLQDTIVDIWHADNEGTYDNVSSDFKYRGRILTDGDGAYAFMSILPAPYDNGGQFRPRHIHYRVAAEGHSQLVTQLYFEDDEFIPDDPWASQAEAGRIIALTENDGVLSGVFNIFLREQP